MGLTFSGKLGPQLASDKNFLKLAIGNVVLYNGQDKTIIANVLTEYNVCAVLISKSGQLELNRGVAIGGGGGRKYIHAHIHVLPDYRFFLIKFKIDQFEHDLKRNSSCRIYRFLNGKC